jgi:hypothetical protein
MPHAERRSPAGPWLRASAVGLHVIALRRLTTAVLVVALLGGCVTTTRKTIYMKPGASEEQKKKDEAECVQAAIDTAGPRAAAFIAVDRETVDRCMRQRGYTLALLAE